jgi:sigma-54 dependent transcriptional regulator of gfr operon
MREELIAYLQNQTAFFSVENVSDIFTAKDIAEKFSVKRNTISHYLNQLTEEGILVKIATRPVYFFHKQAFELQNYPLSQTVYDRLAAIAEEKPFFDQKEDFFSSVIGSKGSLAEVIEQIKMAAFYPNGGLPFLLTGESGTGKSFLVKMFHHYCVANELLEVDAPLVTINCAQYANNQELLTSNLFGHVKGAFTGADEDHAGAFEAANGGVLFLDEVHRLNAEGQEKLFTFLDQGIIYPMGETRRGISVNCRLVFATTEDLKQTFLTTFLRRIPIQTTLPSLDERTMLERKQLIIQAFSDEQRRINVPLEISPQVIETLTTSHFSGNVGELKSTIKIITAKSYTSSLKRGTEKIAVTLYHLPEHLLQLTDGPNELATVQPILIDEHTQVQQLTVENEPEQQNIIHTYEQILLNYVQMDQDFATAAEPISKVIERLFENLLFEHKQEQNQRTMIFVTEHVQRMMEQIEHSFQISFNGSMVYTISYYLWLRRNVEWLPEDQEKRLLTEKLLKSVKTHYSTSDRYTENLIGMIQKAVDIELTSMDRIIFTIYINDVGYTKNSMLPRSIIVAHGYATASSIANVANRLLNESVFQSFDMPLDVTPKQIAERITTYIHKNDVSNGLVVLFDMGSLKEIYQYFPELSVPIIMMNNVTTSLAIAAGECIQQNVPLKEIPERVTSSYQNEWEIILPQTKKEKVLITTCSTGIGTAVQISTLIEKSIPDHLQIQVLPYEFSQLENAEQFKQTFAAYDIVGIVGTTKPRQELAPFISLEELISGAGTEKLLGWLKEELAEDMITYVNNQLVRNFSLDRVIQSVTILDTEKVISQMEFFAGNLERMWQQRIANDRKLALFVHTSCLIERLIRNEAIENYHATDTLLQCHEKELKEIKKAFSVIEKVYSVVIPESEVCYIHDVLFGNTDSSMVEADF